MLKTSFKKSEIGFEQLSPCNDCPFKKNAPFHNGIVKDLPQYIKDMDKGEFAHTCHKTDPRADGYKEGYAERPQHCVGAIHMLKLEEIQPGTLEFLCRDIDGFDKLKGGDDCFKNKKEMIRHYIKLIKRKNKR